MKIRKKIKHKKIKHIKHADMIGLFKIIYKKRGKDFSFPRSVFVIWKLELDPTGAKAEYN